MKTLIVNPLLYVIAGAERECQRHNINLMYANRRLMPQSRLRPPAMLLDDLVDGIIIVGAFLEEMIADISRRAGRNIVLVDAYVSGTAAFDSVLIDNYRGAFNAVSYLIENGHRKIGLIGSCHDSYPSILERRKGYLSALEYHRIHEVFIEEGELTRQDGYHATQRLMPRAPDITAIFACNDSVAFGVSALRDAGYRIPDDVSVVGFDDIHLAQEVLPPLTTVHVDKVLMGAVALRHLRDRAEDPDRPALKTLISTQLIQRGSVRHNAIAAR